jgi:hypothetical protein
MSSLKDSTERVKENAKVIRQEVRGLLGGLTESAPRPIADRITERTPILLHEPLLKTLRQRRQARTATSAEQASKP